MFDSYEATVKFLYENLPMFQRIGAAALKNDLSNTIRLCAVLGDPQKKFKSIHIAGTNGKGSSSHILASIFQEGGYKTGLYTSPHLHDFTERVKINGTEISKEFIVDFVNRIYPSIISIEPSFFEITVALAFDYFAKSAVEIAIIETGLGGRLDSTNVITPELSLITNIGWDHKDILGDTLEKIAYEKAGIIKPSVPVVVSERQPGIDEIFMRVSETVKAPIAFATDHFTVDQYLEEGEVLLTIKRDGKTLHERIALPLQGFYQRKNVLGVLQVIEILKERGWKVEEATVWKGLMQVISNTGLLGRWQILGRNPLVVCDTGHNEDGIREVVEQIAQQSYDQLHIVLGMVKDKDISNILALLPKDAKYYFCQSKIPRALDANLLAEQAARSSLYGAIIPDVNEAIRIARSQASKEDMIFIGGSTFVVAEIENL